MRRNVLALGVLIASPAIAYCGTVDFTVNPANLGVVEHGSPVDLFSSGLDGTALTGQSLSLDLVFSDQVLAKLFIADPGAFGVTLEIYTNSASAPGFPGSTTGYLLDPTGNQFGTTMDAGRADGSNGTFAVGLSGFTSGDLDNQSVFEISGLDFDTVFPTDRGVVVTGTELIFSMNNKYNGIEFGSQQQLPEGSSTLVLTLADLLALALAARCLGLKRLSALVDNARHRFGLRSSN